VLDGFCSIGIFHPDVDVHHEQTIGYRLYDGFHINIFRLGYVFSVAVKAERTLLPRPVNDIPFGGPVFAQCRYSSVKMSRISPSSYPIEQNIGLAKLYAIHQTMH